MEDSKLLPAAKEYKIGGLQVYQGVLMAAK
jgi:hypothetical protein